MKGTLRGALRKLNYLELAWLTNDWNVQIW